MPEPLIAYKVVQILKGKYVSPLVDASMRCEYVIGEQVKLQIPDSAICLFEAVVWAKKFMPSVISHQRYTILVCEYTPFTGVFNWNPMAHTLRPLIHCPTVTVLAGTCKPLRLVEESCLNR